MSDKTIPVIVFDNGSEMCKVGFAGKDDPKAEFLTVLGRPKHRFSVPGLAPDTYAGNYAEEKKCILELNYPIKNGIIENWDDMEKIWDYAFSDELQVSPHDYAILLTEAALNPKSNRIKMAQIMFEHFEVPAMYVAIPPVLSLYASGYTTGTVLDCGGSVSQSVCIYEGYPLEYSVSRLNLAGRYLTDHLITLLSSDGNTHFNTSSRRESARIIKEKLCYVALDYDEELTKPYLNKSYTLPSGEEITINKESFQCPEPLFQPNNIGMDSMGIHKMLNNTIMKSKSDETIQEDLSANIIISGGSTMYTGLTDRLKKELLLLAPTTTNSNFVAPSNRKYSTWIGGSILASLSTFQEMWCSKRDYDEFGGSIIYRKCF